jgi:hypothetical protein
VVAAVATTGVTFGTLDEALAAIPLAAAVT